MRHFTDNLSNKFEKLSSSITCLLLGFFIIQLSKSSRKDFIRNNMDWRLECIGCSNFKVASFCKIFNISITAADHFDAVTVDDTLTKTEEWVVICVSICLFNSSHFLTTCFISDNSPM